MDAALEKPMRFPQLHCLGLNDTSITDTGLSRLVELKNLRKLEALRTSITPDYSRRPGRGRARCCPNSAKAIRRGIRCASVCSLAERPKFRQRLCLLVPAYEVMNNAGYARRCFRASEVSASVCGP